MASTPSSWVKTLSSAHKKLLAVNDAEAALKTLVRQLADEPLAGETVAVGSSAGVVGRCKGRSNRAALITLAGRAGIMHPVRGKTHRNQLGTISAVM